MVGVGEDKICLGIDVEKRVGKLFRQLVVPVSVDARNNPGTRNPGNSFSESVMASSCGGCTRRSLYLYRPDRIPEGGGGICGDRFPQFVIVYLHMGGERFPFDLTVEGEDRIPLS